MAKDEFGKSAGVIALMLVLVAIAASNPHQWVKALLTWLGGFLGH